MVEVTCSWEEESRSWANLMSVMWAEEAKYWPNNCGVMCTLSYFCVCDWLAISFSATFTIFVLEIKQFSEAVAINQNIICLLVLFVSEYKHTLMT